MSARRQKHIAVYSLSLIELKVKGINGTIYKWAVKGWLKTTVKYREVLMESDWNADIHIVRIICGLNM